MLIYDRFRSSTKAVIPLADLVSNERARSKIGDRPDEGKKRNETERNGMERNGTNGDLEPVTPSVHIHTGGGTLSHNDLFSPFIFSTKTRQVDVFLFVSTTRLLATGAFLRRLLQSARAAHRLAT
ncbi:hypothetical protein HZH66_003339 [Vespula vulgaris]|uniref:Uncharacterized protein n=1 Tax=Vespula vulgaris TaxID=7454 RepID=A0A834KLM2_VESVU|nr:hypothetical protein HZH66_003339 [Vespula vulgaris]